MKFEDIAGLNYAKKCVKELIILPIKKPELFTGLRSLPKGLLMFGPPGTGKTMIGKAIACSAGATFFSISASSLTSKWIGEGEKMVRALFAVASTRQPAVIFIDEIDSLLTQRSSTENEASRRIKTEFLVQLDGCGTADDERVVVVGATNRPQELDEAARRRMVKRIYIPLPSETARRALVTILLSSKGNEHTITGEELEKIVKSSKGYSGADVKALCGEAAMGPVRELLCQPGIDMDDVQTADIRPIHYGDFAAAFDHVRATVSQSDLDAYVDWNKQYGSFPIELQQE